MAKRSRKEASVEKCQVVIIHQGPRPQGTVGVYDESVQSLKSVLEQAEGCGRGGDRIKIAEVQVVWSAEKVPASASVAVFTTEKMREEAEAFRKTHPMMRVVLFTGGSKEDRVRVIPGQPGLFSKRAVQAFVLE